jgi:hypothetical protein
MEKKYHLSILAVTLSAAFLCIAPGRAFAWEPALDPDTKNQVVQPNSCFYYSVNENGSDDIALDDLLEIIRMSFDTWEDVDCSFFYFVDTMPASVERAEYNLDKGNVNLFVWREEMEDWHYQEHAIAMTTVTYDKTGFFFEIVDTDIEFNGAYFEFGTAESGDTDNLVDLQTVITHEIGHTVGLADLYDTQYEDSTMYGLDIHENDGTVSTDKRDLHQDDMDGLCTIYPLEEDPEECELPICGLDLNGNSTTCIDEENGGGGGSDGCQTAATGLERPAPLFSRLLALF